MSSLGPKLSAVALYQIHKLHPSTALAYAPSQEYNREYSTGLGETFYGQVGNREFMFSATEFLYHCW